MNDLEEEIIHTLSNEPSPLDFQDIQPEEDSPLNQAVKEKDIAQTNPENWNVWKPENGTNPEEDETISPSISDAPQQDIEGQTQPVTSTQEEEEEEEEKPFQLPKEAAKQSANALLGMANNMLEVGGGFIIKIKKHKDFYDFDDIVTLVDQQNSKNIQRIKLDKDDKALLRPLIMAMLQQKAKTLSPTQQLMGAILSILLKKAQIIMQVRAENNMLVDRILNIIKEEKQEKVVDTTQDTDATEQEKDQGTQQAEEPQNQEYTQEEFYDTSLPQDVLEVVEDKPLSNDT